MKNKFLKRAVVIGLSTLNIINMTMPAFAKDYRDAGDFMALNPQATVNNRTFISSNGEIYYPHNEGGYTVNVPYSEESLRKSGRTVQDQMFDFLFDIYDQGIGSNYESAGFKYAGLGSINGVQTKYYTKNVSFESYERTYESTPATSNIGRD